MIAYKRPDNDHISLYEQHVAAENITNLFNAEKKLLQKSEMNYIKSRINPSIHNDQGLKNL